MNANESLLGRFARLYITKITKSGAYLASYEDRDFEVLLPGSQLPKPCEKGDILDVFLYRDSEDRLIATTAKPYVTLHQTAALTVKEVTDIGAFLDWGLAKDLFLPFKEQTYRVKAGDTVLAALYIDKSSRLCATMRVYDYLSRDSSYQKGDHVEGRVYEILDSFGAFVAVDNRYSALIPRNEMTRELQVGEPVAARVKEVTADGKLTLTLQEKIKVQMNMDAEKILARLSEAGGFLPFHDKTSPEIIKREFQMSKAAFKRAIGRLMKQGEIQITDSGIRLKNKNS